LVQEANHIPSKNVERRFARNYRALPITSKIRHDNPPWTPPIIVLVLVLDPSGLRVSRMWFGLVIKARQSESCLKITSTIQTPNPVDLRPPHRAIKRMPMYQYQNILSLSHILIRDRDTIH
jgi:hypothetical protein